MKKQPIHIQTFDEKYLDKVHTSLIGRYCYPNDNSYAFEVRTKDNYNLAAYEDEIPFKVLIVSEPYKLRVRGLSDDRISRT